MGIFRQKKARGGQEILQEERYKLLGRELQRAFVDMHQILSEAMIQDEQGPELVAFEKRQLEIFSKLNVFLNNIFGSGFGDQKVPPEWERLAALVRSSEFSSDPRRSALPAELMEVSNYYLDCVNSGNLGLMPNTNLSNSKRYRSYLLGNQLNSDLDWGWNNDPQTSREEIDSILTKIIAKMITSILDKVGPGHTLEAACALGVSICLSWEISSIRAGFK